MYTINNTFKIKGKIFFILMSHKNLHTQNNAHLAIKRYTDEKFYKKY